MGGMGPSGYTRIPDLGSILRAQGFDLGYLGYDHSTN